MIATPQMNCCEVGLVAPSAGFVLAPCGHALFCESCSMRMSDMNAGCPVSRADITMTQKSCPTLLSGAIKGNAATSESTLRIRERSRTHLQHGRLHWKTASQNCIGDDQNQTHVSQRQDGSCEASYEALHLSSLQEGVRADVQPSLTSSRLS